MLRHLQADLHPCANPRQLGRRTNRPDLTLQWAEALGNPVKVPDNHTREARGALRFPRPLQEGQPAQRVQLVKDNAYDFRRVPLSVHVLKYSPERSSTESSSGPV